MRRLWRLSLVLIVAGPGPLFAQVVAPVTIRISAPVAPMPGSLGPLGASAPGLQTLSPNLSAPSLAVSAPGVQAPQALAPVLAAPSAIPHLPATAVPIAAAPNALSVQPLQPAASKMDALGFTADQQVPRTAFEGLKAELAEPQPDDADLDGGREHAARSFETKLGIMSFVPAALTAFTEGAFHTLAKVKTPPPAQAGDDGGGPTKPRKIEFNGEVFPSVAFRPNEPVESQIVRAIETSKETIQIALYEFTSRGILKALLAANKRGVKVEIILCDSAANPRNEPDADYNRYRSEQIWALIRNKMDVTVVGRPTKYGINHHKFAIFDGKMAEYGSYNWTYTSEKSHYENVMFSAEADRIEAYKDAWTQLRSLSVSVAESATKEWTLDVPAPPSDDQKRIKFNGIRLPAWIFTPNELYEDSIVAAIDASKVSIDAATFVMESRRIADALERALKRGVKVRIVGDKSQSAHDNVQLFLGWLQRKGAQVRLLGGPNGEDSDYPLAEKMHNKYFLFDGKLVETGSANATKNASVNNFENANFLDDKTDVAAFKQTYEHMFDIAETAPAFPEGELRTDAEMREDALKPRGPPAPPDPAHDPIPAARRIAFNGVDFPVSAIRPHEPIEAELVKQIDSAAKTLKIAMYEFNLPGIWDALQRAKKRGVKIAIVIDRSHVYTSGYEDDGTPRRPKQMVVDLIKDGGFDVLVLKGRLGGIMHNKFIIADEALVSMGSFNYTRQSEEDHYENVFFSIEKARVKGYMKYFEYMQGLAEEPDLEKLEEVLTRTEAALPEADDAEPEMAGRRKPLPPDPPQETETPIELNGELFPIHMFSPNSGIEQALVRAIEASKATIEIAMFSFFSQPIAEALLRAKDRGVHVRIVMDKSQTGTSKLDEWFAWHGFELRLISGPDRSRDPRYQKMHNKFAIFDGLMLESGSFNFSTRAETLSFENANYFNDADEIARFAAAFLQMFERGMAPKAPRRQPIFTPPASEPEA